MKKACLDAKMTGSGICFVFDCILLLAPAKHTIVHISKVPNLKFDSPFVFFYNNMLLVSLGKSKRHCSNVTLQ